MNRFGRVAIIACAALLMARVVYAEVTLNSVRVASTDTVALAKFYQTAFGMHEVNRIAVPGGPEIFVNFGASVDAAKANQGAPIVIMHRDSNALQDPIAHVILNVTDMSATAAAVKAAATASGQKLRLRRHEGYDHSYWFIQSFVADHLAHHARQLQP